MSAKFAAEQPTPSAKDKFAAATGPIDGTPDAAGHSEAPLIAGRGFFDPALETEPEAS